MNKTIKITWKITNSYLEWVIAKIDLYDVNLNKKSLLKSVNTSSSWEYTLEISTMENQKFDLQLFASQNKKQIANSKIYYSRNSDIKVDLVVWNEQINKKPEFTILDEKITPILWDTDISKISAENLEYLSWKTWYNSETINYYVEAKKQNKITSLDSELLYAFFRQWFWTDIQKISLQPDSVLKSTLSNASTNGLISKDKINQVDSLVASLYSYSSKNDVNNLWVKSDIHKVLEFAWIKPADKQKFLDSFYKNVWSTSNVFDKLKTEKVLADKSIDNIKLSSEIVSFSWWNDSMATVVKELVGTWTELSSISKYDLKDWQNIISKNKTLVPSNIEGANATEKNNNYAKQIFNNIENAFPDARVKHKLISKNNETSKFLNKYSDFNIATTDINKYFEANISKLKKDVKDLDTLKSDLKKNQRLYKLTPTNSKYESIEILDKSGITSSLDILKNYSKNKFVNKFSSDLGGNENAEFVYNKAKDTSQKVTSVLWTIVSNGNFTWPGVVTATVQANTSLINIPDFQSLFWNQSYCECNECKSVLSPAAYLVDLLEFLRNSDENDEWKTPYDLLLEKRPDLINIQLSCENTNTALPYIDLVIEILENAVLLSNWQAANYTYQSTWTTSELQAFPENINSAAYDILDKAVFPFTLPFNYSNSQADSYISKLNTSRYDIIKNLQYIWWANEPTDIYKAQANLWLSTNKKDIIIGQKNIWWTNYNIKDFWWKTQSTWKTDLSNVETFLNTTSISYKDLLLLIQVEYINPNKDIVIDFSLSEDGCDLSLAYLKTSDWKSVSQDFFEKTHIFLRLNNTLNWWILELWDVIKTLWNKLDEDTLKSISDIKYLINEYKIDLLELLSWWWNLSNSKDVNDDSSRSYYESVFLNKSVMNPVNSDFVLSSDGLSLIIETTWNEKLISDYSTFISACLWIKESDLNYFIESLESDKLNISNLAQLHRLSSVSKTFWIQAKYLLKMFRLISDSIFTSTDSAVKFSEKLEIIKESKLDEKKLSYLLLHDYYENEKINLSDDKIWKSLYWIKDWLLKIISQNTYESDPSWVITNSKLALILPQEIYTDINLIINEQSILDLASQQDMISEYLTFLDSTEAIYILTNIDDTLTKETRIQNRYNYIFGPLLDYVINLLSTELISQKVSDDFWLDLDTSMLLVTELIISKLDSSKYAVIDLIDNNFVTYDLTDETEISRELFPVQYDVWLTIYKSSILITSLWFNNDELIWMYKNSSDLNWIDLNSLPLENITDSFSNFESWIKVNKISLLNNQYRTDTTSSLTLFDMVINSEEYETPSTLDDFINLYVDLSWFEKTDIEFLLWTSAYNFQLSDFTDTDKFYQIDKVLKLADKLWTTTKSLFSWSIWDLDNNLSLEIVQLVKSKYSKEQWLSTAPSLRNTLRETQRTALNNYLIWYAWFEDEIDIYDKYLIDTEMQSEMLTSRIKQANSSIQLFIQRCFMWLEENVTLETEQKEQWEWMSKYRIWEANRKVFLFPENWLEPELRTSKTEFFQSLENELMQDQINDENVERAISRYIERIDSVSWLDILWTYHYKETVDEEELDVLHVIARTKSSPHIYYYRKKEDWEWTAWEKIDLDIDSDFVMPIVVNWRLLLFWAKFRENTKEATRLYNEDPDAIWEFLESIWYNTEDEIQDYLESISEPFVYYDIDIYTSEYKYDKWSPSKKTKESFSSSFFHPNLLLAIFWVGPFLAYLTWNLETTSLADFRFYIYSSSNNVYLNCYQKVTSDTWNYEYSIKKVKFDLSTQSFSLESANDTEEYAILNSSLSYNKYTLSNYYDLTLYKDEDKNTVTVLDSQDYSSTITLHSQYPKYYSQTSLFYQDLKRSYFVTPIESSIVNKYKIWDKYISSGSWIMNYSSMNYRFENFFHPYSTELMKILNLYWVSDVLSRDTQLLESEYFDSYWPQAVTKPYPKDEIDFTYWSAFGIYNWELFYHIPMLIANKLNQEQNFEEAQKWYHYIFNPIDKTGDIYDTPQHYWQFKPFFEEYDLDSISDLIYALSYNWTDSEMLAKKELVESQIEAWKSDPFEPHTIAALRNVAYMKNTVLKYIDNLIDWWDSLFSEDTIESINEATQLYILAYQLMWKRPEEVPSTDKQDYTYSELLEKWINAFSNSLVELESTIASWSDSVTTSSTGSLLYNLYFCLPHNKQLLTYWDNIEDRLFKIRNSMNIDWVKRSLSLFDAPIDPGMLVNAKAAWIDLWSILSDLNSPLPNYRFTFYISRAKDYVRDIQWLASNLLSALEKKDAEELSILRNNQEISLQSSIKDLKKLYIDEAYENLSSLEQSKSMIEKRYEYYRDIEKISWAEIAQAAMIWTSGILQWIAQWINIWAAITALIPDVEAWLTWPVPTANSKLTWWEKIAASMNNVASWFNIAWSMVATASSITWTLASYSRRWNDWKLQEKLAKIELKQIWKQIEAAKIRVSIMEKDLSNFEKQMEQSLENKEFMTSKYTNKDLYDWMVSQISGLYFQAYKLAYECSKRAQKCYQYELNSSQTFIQYWYWDSLKKWLTSWDKLLHDLKRMEMAYFEQNKRQLEITKHISLSLFDPLSLEMLKQNWECYINIPESLFDIDYPWHYNRRIKSISISMPCITWPYTSINWTLTLLENKFRKNTNIWDGYTELEGNQDERFSYNSSSIQSISTSGWINDSWMFQLSFQDEKYLPFEWAWAISKWRFKLPDKFKSFDYTTITDLIIHMNYQSKDWWETFKQTVNESIETEMISMIMWSWNTWLTRAFSLQSSFSNDWYSFINPSDWETNSLTINISNDYFPLIFKDYSININQVDIYAISTEESVNISVVNDWNTWNVELTSVSWINNLIWWTVKIWSSNLSWITWNWSIEWTWLSKDNISDFIILFHYNIS